jgi:hypothetical protein
MAGAGYRTFQSGEVLTSTNVQTYLMDQAVQVYAGTAARSSAVPSPSAGMVAYSTATGLQVFNGSAWIDVGGIGYGAATGGIGSPTAVTIGGVNYQYLTFNSTGLLTITKSGFFDFCAIGGGGGALSIGIGGYAGGGGGAGQVSIASVYLDTNQTITIGAGGAFYLYTTFFTKAGDTTVGATAPFVIGAAGNGAQSSQAAISLGYIGGGVGSADSKTSVAITESTLIGFRGGNSDAITNAGGGGGQSARGGNASGTQGGTGGAGFDVSAFIGGSATFKAQGAGGGGSVTGGAAATGGVAGSATTTPSNGGANTGQGGGGGYQNQTTGNGGSGICYIRFKV